MMPIEMWSEASARLRRERREMRDLALGFFLAACLAAVALAVIG
jgi:hypothetical protein